MRILVLGPQLANIGNGFIAKGAVATLKQAFPSAEIVESSAYPYYIADMAVENGGSEGLRNQTVGVGEFVDPDLVVFPGCVLYPDPIRRHLPLFKKFDKQNIPVVFLGVGGNDYETETKSTVRKLLQEANIDALISRDKTAYETYADSVSVAAAGIDNGFFIDDWYDPPTADRDFVVSVFDKSEEIDIDTNLPIVRPHHAPFDILRDVYEGAGLVGTTLKMGRTLVSSNELRHGYDELQKNNLFISDNIEDYLFIYKNATEVYTDRIHAAVPAMVFGNRARFKYDTPRAQLLQNIVVERDDFYIVSEADLRERKEQQIDTLKSFVEGKI